MQYEPAAEKTTMMPGQAPRLLTKEDYDRYPPTRSARTRVLVVLIIQLVLVALHFVGRVGSIVVGLSATPTSVNTDTTRYGAGIYDRTTRPGKFFDDSTIRNRGNSFDQTTPFEFIFTTAAPQLTVGGAILGLFMAILPLIFFIAFIVVVVKYIRIGILVFAWLVIVELVIIGIYVIIILVSILTATTLMGSAAVGVIISVFIIIGAGIGCILSILTAVFSFKLAKLLKTHQHTLTV